MKQNNIKKITQPISKIEFS